ncbi:WYL domain-containing protein [Halosquirtibacter laminarini]|uniref:WYL domain-containing protein n=1 Tax=Halosquirtibacter laminarini TaxID=3374600 RepID=A0AC61NIH5_9BACT|nr:WYL domain-containing protein [Prolixibacteraceae bacterium]
MSTNRNAIIRYKTLDRCFRSRSRDYTFHDLLEACNKALVRVNPKSTGISERTLRGDIADMKKPELFDAPIETRQSGIGKSEYYYYDDPNFMIFNQPLDEGEEYHLREALQTLSQFKGLPHLYWVDEIMLRLRESLNIDPKECVMMFDENPNLEGRGFMTGLYDSIVREQTIKLLYKPFNYDEPFEVEVSPYLLKQYNNRWFLFAWGMQEDCLRIYSLDRIKKVVRTNGSYRKNVDVDFQDFFEEIVGVTHHDIPEQEILLKVDLDLIPYILTKPLHPSQSSFRKEEGIIRICVVPNYELESLILSFGDRMEVLEPIEFRERIGNRVARLSERYSTKGGE